MIKIFIKIALIIKLNKFSMKIFKKILTKKSIDNEKKEKIVKL